jgi:hypothetical protein
MFTQLTCVSLCLHFVAAAGPDGAPLPSKYDLIANVVHILIKSYLCDLLLLHAILLLLQD